MPATKSTHVPKFTRAGIAALLRDNPVDKRIREDASPLVLKVTTGGGQWCVIRKVAGKVKTFTPKTPDGTVIKNAATVWPPEQARKWATGVVGDLAQGREPVPERRPRSTTFAAMSAEHLAEYRRRARPSSVVAREYGIKYALAVLGNLSVVDIDTTAPAALEAALDTPSKRVKAFVACREVLSFAVRQGFIGTNVFAAAKAPARPASRDRYPTLDELARIDAAAVEEGTVGAQLVRFLIRCPLRRTAAASLLWHEVDLQGGELRLEPQDGRKTTTMVRLPLNDAALALLREQPRGADSDLVFPGTDRAGRPRPFQSWGWIVRRLRKRSGVAGWSLHDFRRAVVSHVAERRPDIDVLSLDKLLGHAGTAVMGGTAAIYQRSAHWVRMRAAADAWGQLVEQVTGNNVRAFGRSEAC
jgi:integrase